MTTDDASKGLLEKLHEPICPYSSAAYRSLCTVVQAFPLIVLFWVITEDKIYQDVYRAIEAGNLQYIQFKTWYQVIEIVISLTVVAVIWHRYVLDIQFVAWPLTAIDTAIPFAFALWQCLLAISIRFAPSPTPFSVFMLLIIAWGLVAYLQMVPKFRRPQAHALYMRHFGNEFGEQIHADVQTYLKAYVAEFKIYIFCAIVAVIVCWWNPDRHEIIGSIVVAILTEIVVWRLFVRDIHFYLKRWLVLALAAGTDVVISGGETGRHDELNRTA